MNITRKRNALVRGMTALLLVCALVVGALQPFSKAPHASAAVKLTGKTKKVAFGKTFYGKHGRLQVKGTKLVDKAGKAIQLKGISSHGINWDVGEPFVNEKALQNLRDEWGVNCFRVAMYTEEYNGYCVTDAASRKKLLQKIDVAVKAGKKLGMYVIIDWHILSDGNPKKNQSKAKAFFKKVANKYRGEGHVLYEICNEPNGGTDWKTIKSYAKTIIKVIRKYSKKSVILVGTPTWSQDVDVASRSPIRGYKNIMYTFHFYAATHKDDYRKKVQTALNNKLPLICTEFSACDASGNGGCDFSSANKWIRLMNKYKISYCCWSLSNKPETASLLKSSCKRTSGFKTSDLSKMGRWIVKKYRK